MDEHTSEAPDPVVEAALRVAYAEGRRAALLALKEKVGPLAETINATGLRAAIDALTPSSSHRTSRTVHEPNWEPGARTPRPVGWKLFIRGVELGQVAPDGTAEDYQVLEARADRALVLAQRGALSTTTGPSA